MSRYLGPRKKLERRFGLIEGGPVKLRPKKRGNTGYGERLEEKQKAKFIYGVLEKQFKRYVDQALKSDNQNQELMRQLETRLDNTVHRFGFAPTIPAARQLVSHGFVKLDGNKVDRPSYQVRSGQTLTLDKARFLSSELKKAERKTEPAELPAWLWREENSGKILNLPRIEDMRRDINTVYILEFYSK